MNIGWNRTNRGKPFCPGNDFLFLLSGELAEATAPLNTRGVASGKLLHFTPEETNPLATSHLIPPGNEPMVSPSGDGLGGDVESFRNLFYGEHWVVAIDGLQQSAGSGLLVACRTQPPLRGKEAQMVNGVGEGKGGR